MMDSVTINNIVTTTGTVLMAVVAYATLRLNNKIAESNRQEEKAAKDRQEVKKKLEDANTVVNTKLDDIGNVNLSNHDLLNSSKRVLLKSNMDLWEFRAQSTGKEEDKKSFAQAQKEYHDHEEAQARVDANPQQTDSINREKAAKKN